MKNIFTVAIVLILFVALLYIVKNPAVINDILIKSGVIPKMTAWFCLIYGTYGLARSRLSLHIAMLFFTAAFFIAYIGPHIPFLRNYY